MATNRREQQKREIRYASAKERAEKHEMGFTPTSFKPPDGVKLFKISKEGIYRFDILPYIVGKGNNMADEGMTFFERTYYDHPRIGPDENKYCCLRRTFKSSCPICERQAQLKRDPSANEKLVKSLSPKERQLFNIIDLNNKDEGIQIFEYSFYLFGKKLDEKVQAKPAYGSFYYLEGGFTIEVKFKEGGAEGITWMEATNIEMEPRKRDYDEEILDQTYCLDDLLIKTNYESLRKIFYQETDREDDKEDDSKSTRNTSSGKQTAKKTSTDDDDEDDDKRNLIPTNPFPIGTKVTHKKYGECTVIKSDEDAEICSLEDTDGDTFHKISFDVLKLSEAKPEAKKGKVMDDDDDDDKEDVKPAKGKKVTVKDDDDDEDEKPAKSSKSTSRKAADADEDDDEDDDDLPRKKTKKK